MLLSSTNVVYNFINRSPNPHKQQSLEVVHWVEHADIALGVPLGSVIGPALFVCHIIDLPDSLPSNCKAAACWWYYLLWRARRSYQPSRRTWRSWSTGKRSGTWEFPFPTEVPAHFIHLEDQASENQPQGLLYHLGCHSDACTHNENKPLPSVPNELHTRVHSEKYRRQFLQVQVHCLQTACKTPHWVCIDFVEYYSFKQQMNWKPFNTEQPHGV